MKSIVLLSSKPWNKDIRDRLNRILDYDIHLIQKEDFFNYEAIKIINPEWIFVLHWSSIIPQKIWKTWRTIIFHMTDLPYGRGGSPLQNLIKNNHTSTILSAIECQDKLDSGDIYLKKPLSLYGSAEEIFIRADKLMELMIKEIIKNDIVPKEQEGDVVIFKRRIPEESNLITCKEGDLESWHNHIRMLDAEGYPPAFLEIHGMILEFSRSSFKHNGLKVDVIIKKKE